MNGDEIKVEGHGTDFTVCRLDSAGCESWRFNAEESAMYVEGNYYSYRYNNGHIYIILGDAPKYVPINADRPMLVKPNPANYQLGVLNTVSGEIALYQLKDATKRKECRIEAVRDKRVLVSCDGTQLVEYEVA